MVFIVFACFLLAVYFAAYFMNSNLPGASSKAPLGWWGWFDQGEYYRSVKALDQQNFDPSEYHYPIGYPLIGTLFYSVMPHTLLDSERRLLHADLFWLRPDLPAVVLSKRRWPYVFLAWFGPRLSWKI